MSEKKRHSPHADGVSTIVGHYFARTPVEESRWAIEYSIAITARAHCQGQKQRFDTMVDIHASGIGFATFQNPFKLVRDKSRFATFCRTPFQLLLHRCQLGFDIDRNRLIDSGK